MPRARTSAAALLALTALTAALAAGPAAAASAATDPNWWYSKYHVADAQAAGLTGAGVKIAVIDGAINPDLAVFDGADLTVHEPNVCGLPAATTQATEPSVHGSDVTALLIGNGTGPGAVRGIVPGAELEFYANGTDGGTCTEKIDGRRYSSIGLGIRQALADGSRIISISQGSTDQYDGDFSVIAQAIARGVVIVASTENEVGTVGSPFPHRANGVVSVNAFKPDGSLQTQADGTPVMIASTTVVAAGWSFPSQAAVSPSYAFGDNAVRLGGASLATPIVAGMVALVAQKYPEATGNQLIQSLIRNTGNDDHELRRTEDGYGYGAASATHMLKQDPTHYADENPLMDQPEHLGMPTTADVEAEKQAPARPSTSSTDSAEMRRGGFSAVTTFLVFAGIVGGLIVIAGVVLLIVLLSRRRPSTGG